MSVVNNGRLYDPLSQVMGMGLSTCVVETTGMGWRLYVGHKQFHYTQEQFGENTSILY